MNRLQYLIHDLKYRLSCVMGNSLRARGHMVARHLVPTPGGGLREVGRREVWGVVTDAFVAFVVDQLQTETSAFGDFKYHDSGTGTNAEAAGDTALQTPCGEARTVGSQSEGATANVYKSVGTHTYAGTFAITEHGLFNAASGVTLMDRTVFAAINVESGHKIEFTYEITLPAGG